MLWSSGDELDDEDVLTYLFIIPLCMGTGYYNCLTLMYIVYSNDCKYKLFSFFCKNMLLSIIFCSAAIVGLLYFFSLPILLLPPSSSFTDIRNSRGWEFRVVTFGIRAKVRNTLALLGFTH